MIHSVLIINNFGQPRLVRFYTPLELKQQQELIKQINNLLNQRTPQHSNVLTLPDLLKSADGEEEKVRIIHRLYATLNFVFVVDEQESELGILDLIQVFVQALDKCFQNVCELDLVFGWETLETVLEELIQGGLVLETNSDRIVAAVDSANNQKISDSNVGYINGSVFMKTPGSAWGLPLNEDAVNATGRAISNAGSLIKSFFPSK